MKDCNHSTFFCFFFQIRKTFCCIFLENECLRCRIFSEEFIIISMDLLAQSSVSNSFLIMFTSQYFTKKILCEFNTKTFENRTGASPGTFFTVSGTARMVPAEDLKMNIGTKQRVVAWHARLFGN